MATFYSGKLIADWELLKTALQPHLTDLPYLTDKAAELEGLIAEAKGMDTRQQELCGQPSGDRPAAAGSGEEGDEPPPPGRRHAPGQLRLENQTLLSC